MPGAEQRPSGRRVGTAAPFPNAGDIRSLSQERGGRADAESDLCSADLSGPRREPARLQDVAALAGVSRSTASNVLNHPQQVAGATRRRVRAAIDELGFVRDESARLLRSASA